ncbi:MAG: hypothetical protein GY792_01000 [Gammaproteobacteria bacterium]|nr:hypothetical protein [Gammaproteobacteria bacterium]
MKRVSRALSVISTSLLAAGCDTAMKIHGFAPKVGHCKIQLVNNNNGKVISSRSVKGEFTTTFVWGVLEGKMDIVSACEGLASKIFADWVMPELFSEPLEVGDISP